LAGCSPKEAAGKNHKLIATLSKFNTFAISPKTLTILQFMELSSRSEACSLSYGIIIETGIEFLNRG
jgi:hypothetical protein